VSPIQKEVSAIRDAPQLDEVAVDYLYDALRAFRAGAFLGTVSLIGAASERLMIIVTEQLEGALIGVEQKNTFRNAIDSRNTRKAFEETIATLQNKRNQLLKELKFDTDSKLHQLYHFIRLARNEVGHPIGAKFQREETISSLFSFARYATETYKVIACLKPDSLS